MTVKDSILTARGISLPAQARRIWIVAFVGASAYAALSIIATCVVMTVLASLVVVAIIVPICLSAVTAVLILTPRRSLAFSFVIAATASAFIWHGVFFFGIVAGDPLGLVPGTAILRPSYFSLLSVPLLILDLSFYFLLAATIAIGFASREMRAAARAIRPAFDGDSDRLNVYAVLALVLSFVIAPVGIVLGHIALAETRRSGERGRGLAIAGLVVGYAWVLVVVLFLAIGIAGR